MPISDIYPGATRIGMETSRLKIIKPRTYWKGRRTPHHLDGARVPSWLVRLEPDAPGIGAD